MAIHHPTPPLGGGERPRLAARHYSRPEQCSGGPVTQAIRNIRANVPAENIGQQTVPAWNAFRALSRAEVEALIGGLIDLLDAMDGDTDLEIENEHGGDIQDEPHDPEEDMGAEEDEGSIGLVAFDGTNYGRMRL